MLEMNRLAAVGINRACILCTVNYGHPYGWWQTIN